MKVREIAAATCLFERATTAKPMLRSRQPHTNPWVQPAESARTTTGRATSLGGVAGPVPGGDLGRELGDGVVEHSRGDRRRCWPRRCRAAAGRRALRRSRPRSTTSGGTRTRACRSARCPPCSPSAPPPAWRRCPAPPARSVLVTLERRHTWARTSAIASHRPAERGRVDLPEGPIQGRVRRHRARTGAPGPAAPRCPRTTRRPRPASASPGSAPCPDHAPAAAHRPAGSGPTARRPAPTGPRTPPGRAARHGPPPPRRPPRSSPAACCYRSPVRCPSREQISMLSQHRECPAGRALSRPGYLTSSHAP